MGSAQSWFVSFKTLASTESSSFILEGDKIGQQRDCKQHSTAQHSSRKMKLVEVW